MRSIKSLILILVVIASAFGMGGCQKQETTEVKKQVLPLVGSPSSPLPTPNTQTSPLKK
jgi:hypothetical protein